MSQLLADLRYGLRLLAKSKLTTGAAIASLALGIGGTTAIFSVVDAVLLRPLPYAEPDRLMMVWSSSRFGERGDHSPGDFLDYRRDARTFEGMAGVFTGAMSLSGDGDPEQLRVQSVSGNFFTLLGVQAIAGRTFVPADDGPDDREGVMLSEGLWKRRYGGRADIIGRQITVADRRVEVVGVMPASFRFDTPVDAWVLGRRGVPRGSQALGDLTTNRDIHIVTVVGRMRRGVSLPAAQAELDGLAARLARAYSLDTGRTVLLEPLASALVGDTRRLVLILFGAVALLLLIASLNIANLLLVRSEGRTLELAMRMALGATRGRLASQILVESVTLAAFGGLLGVALAWWGTDALVRLAPQQLPRLDEVALDARLLGFSLLLTLGVGVGFGLWPAWRASRQTLGTTMNTAARGSVGRDRRRAQQLLVTGELALALVLLIGAGLLVSSFARLLTVQTGFDPHGVVAADVSLPGERYEDPVRKARFHQAVVERLRGEPGVADAAMGLVAPVSFNMTRGVWLEGKPEPPPGQFHSMSFVTISDGYFRVLGIQLRRGRAFTAQDGESAPSVAIVNDTFARRYFPGEDPIGKRIGFGDRTKPYYWRTIVAVAADTRRPADAAPPTAFIPFAQDREPWSLASYMIKTSLPVAAGGDIIRRAVIAADPDQPISRVRTLDEALERSVSVQRFTTLLSTSFAALALLLAAVGTFGVMSHIVGTRTREIGVRMALGAERRDIVTLILGQTTRVVAVATAAGLAGAWVLGGSMQSLLFEVKPGDPTTLATAAGCLVGVALAAGYLPVRRALAQNPLASLRNE